jgi:chemotaxis protein MotB
MSTDSPSFNETSADSSRQQTAGEPASLSEQQRDRPRADFVNIERRVQHHTVFQVDDSSFVSSMPRATHWSIAWSDLMMTMFVLFLSMFVYQAAHEEFLQKKEPEIINGDTTDALKSLDSGRTTFPFAPISPDLPLVSTKTAKTVERASPLSPPVSTKQKDEKPGSETPDSKNIILIAPPDRPVLSSPTPTISSEADENTAEPLPMDSDAPEVKTRNQFQEISAAGRNILENNDLVKFAAIDIVPDKTMRIILTSDLLFALGATTLSDRAKESLEKIAAIIQSIPYMINVVGHTDNIPMNSNRFSSNWELSVLRASAVARFLIIKGGMNPTQFVVSGYSSYRPLVPNTNAENRSRNRRVEIIISKRLPPPHPSTANNLKKKINEK